MTFLLDACHEKTDFVVFVVVIPKEGLARIGGLEPHQSFFGYDNDYYRAMGMTMTKTLKPVFP